MFLQWALYHFFNTVCKFLVNITYVLHFKLFFVWKIQLSLSQRFFWRQKDFALLAYAFSTAFSGLCLWKLRSKTFYVLYGSSTLLCVLPNDTVHDALPTDDCYMHDSFCRCLWRFSRTTASLLLRWCETFKIRHLLISKHGNAANCPAKQRFNLKNVLKIQKSVNGQVFQINIIASNRESNFWVKLTRGKNCNAIKCRSYWKTGVLIYYKIDK